MWLGLVQTKVDKAMVAVKWHKQLDWRPLQYIINILGVGPSEKEEDLTAWLASGYWLEVEELQNNLRYQSFQLEHFEHLWHLNLQCKYLTYESDLSKLWSKERGASAGPCRAPPLYFKAWFRDTGLYRTCIYMDRTHPPSNSNHILWIHWIPVTRRERREMVQGRAQETARIALIWRSIWKAAIF